MSKFKILLTLTRLLWLCIFLVQLWKVKQVKSRSRQSTINIEHLYNSRFNKIKKFAMIFWKHKMQH